MIRRIRFTLIRFRVSWIPEKVTHNIALRLRLSGFGEVSR